MGQKNETFADFSAKMNNFEESKPTSPYKGRKTRISDEIIILKLRNIITKVFIDPATKNFKKVHNKISVENPSKSDLAIVHNNVSNNSNNDNFLPSLASIESKDMSHQCLEQNFLSSEPKVAPSSDIMFLYKNADLSNQLISNFEYKNNLEFSILSACRSTTLDFFVSQLDKMRAQNQQKISSIFSKLSKEKSIAAAKESLFCNSYKLSLERRIPISFVNTVEEKDLLYDVHSNFVCEKRYLEIMEEKAKKAMRRRLQKYNLFHTARKGNASSENNEGLEYEPDDTCCQICNSGDYNDKNLIVFCSVN